MSAFATTRLIIDLDALRANYRTFARRGAVAAVVKADAYGFGVAHIAPVLEDEGCRDFFVATVDEGIALRRVLGRTHIYVLSGPTDVDAAAALAEASVTPVLNNAHQVDLWRRHKTHAVAVQFDTGMHRLGFHPDTDVEVFAGLNVDLVISHLACADTPEHTMNAEQAECFARVRRMFPDTAHGLANSAGMLSDAAADGTGATRQDEARELSRVGIGLYGCSPFAREMSGRERVVPVATFEAQVVDLRVVQAGGSIGYGAEYTAPERRTIAVLGAGYADGIPRAVAHRTHALYKHHHLPIIGRVSMDLTTVDVSGAPHIGIGDWVQLFGTDPTVEAFADSADTIGYEIFTGIGSRVVRHYIAH